MAQFFMMIEIAADDVDRVTQLVGPGWAPHGDGGIEPRSGGVVVQYSIEYPDRGTEEGANVHREFTDALDSGGIAYDMRGNGVSIGPGLSGSRFVIRPIGPHEPADTLTVTAVDRAGFEKQLTTLFPAGMGALPGYQVDVYGLASNDPDLQAPPFNPVRD